MGPLVCQGSDFWGRKWFVVVLTSTGLIGSLVMSRSNSIGVAITGQVIAGFAQSSQPVIHAIASEIIPRKHRSLAQASINTASVLGGVSGLLIAGALTRSNAFGFRRYYYIAAAIYGAAALAFTIFYNPPPRELETALTLRGKLAHLDWVGYGLLVAGSVLLCFALTSSVSSSWTSAVVLAPLLVGALVLGIFGLYEWKFRKDGLVHHGLFSRGRNFYVAIFCIFAEGMVFFAAISYYSAESVLVYGTGAFDAGLYFTVAWWLLLVFAWAAGSYISWSKTIRLPTMGAFLLLALFGALMASLNPTTQSNMVGYAVFVGAGLGVALNSLVVVAQLSIPPELITAATALMITTRSLGGTVALSVYSAIFNHVSHKEIGTRVIKALLPLGFDSQYVEPLIGGLLSHNSALLKTIPGLTPEIMQAAGMAIKEAFSLAFRYVWITSMVASVLALCGKNASFSRSELTLISFASLRLPR